MECHEETVDETQESDNLDKDVNSESKLKRNEAKHYEKDNWQKALDPRAMYEDEVPEEKGVDNGQSNNVPVKEKTTLPDHCDDDFNKVNEKRRDLSSLSGFGHGDLGETCQKSVGFRSKTGDSGSGKKFGSQSGESMSFGVKPHGFAGEPNVFGSGNGDSVSQGSSIGFGNGSRSDDDSGSSQSLSGGSKAIATLDGSSSSDGYNPSNMLQITSEKDETETAVRSFLESRFHGDYNQSDDIPTETAPNINSDSMSTASKVGRHLARIGDDICCKYSNELREMVRELRITRDTQYEVFAEIAKRIFEGGINWGRVAILLCFAYMFLKEEFRQRVPIAPSAEFIVHYVVRFIRERIGHWIEEQGGWRAALNNLCDKKHLSYVSIAVLVFFFFYNVYKKLTRQ